MATGRQAVVGQIHDARVAVGGHVQRQRQFVVTPEVVAQAHQHRAFQHVGFAVGAPGVAHAVVAGTDRDAGLAQARHIGHGTRRGSRRHDVHARLQQAIG
ncbi:hypothetical protein G6F31_019427 [Rhizopus arrhizus]|nr:hypothetical protein G6F31_019427 [Rhizopus arrhizus]